MTITLKTRLEQLEKRGGDSQKLMPGMVYFSDWQSFEEAQAEYERRHGFKLPKDAPVVNFVVYDSSKQSKIAIKRLVM